MRSTTRLYRSVLVASALFSSLAFAQGSAVVTGIVTDAATSKPVPDVVITATSSALQGEEVVVTDSSGLYRLGQLPAGVYTLKLEKESFKPYSRTDINVRTDRTVRVNIQLQPEAVQGDTVVVVGRPPTVDIGSTTTGINVGKDFINNIAFIQPNGSGVRSFESLASVAPQVVADEYGFGFSGAQSPENLYLVDGVSTGDPGYGTNGAQFPIEFVEEANVITGGYMAEYGRATGGVLNVATKSGSNEFHGMVWGNWTPGALQGTPKTIESEATSILLQPKLLNTVDFGAQVGGPIIKDRLWFFVGFAPSFNWDQTTRSLRAFVTDPVTGAETTEVPDSLKRREETNRAFAYIAKLTFLINADNNLSLSLVGTPSSGSIPFSFNERRSATNGWKGGSNSTSDTSTLSLRYQGGFLDKHLLLDASVGWFRLSNSTLPDDGSGFDNLPGDGTAAGTPVVIYRRNAPLRNITEFETLSPAGQALCVDAETCPATGAEYAIGGAGYMETLTLDRLQGRASATVLAQFLGHHVFKAGLDIEHLRYDGKRAYSGGVLLRELTNGTRYDDYRQFGYFKGPDDAERQSVIISKPTSNNIGAYIQDSWSIMDLVTLNLGLRYDNQQLFSTDGTLGMTLNNMFAPRVGVIYDFTQQGRSKLFANYGTYYESVPMNIADRALTGENQFQYQHAVAGNRFAQPGNPGCDPLENISQALNQCQDPLNTRQVNYINGGLYDPNKAGLTTGQGKTPIDPNLKPQSSSEIVVGGEYEVISDGRVGVTYTRRWMDNVIEDMSLDEASTYFIGNPGSGLAAAFPKAVRDYDAVTGYFNKTFSDGWMGQVSYTYSSLRGNYAGLFRPETGQLNPNINSDFDLISLLPNRNGPLDGDRNHFIKAYASKEFQITSSFSVIAGLTYEGRSGAPINYLGSHGLYGSDEVYVLPRGSGGRLPWRHAINAKVGVSYRLSKDNVVQFTTDVFNMFNFQAATAVDNTLTTSDVLPFQTSATDPQAAACLSGSNLPQCSTPAFDADGDPILNADGTQAYELALESPYGGKLSTADLNSNFKRPTAYQAPISVRFGIRFTF